MFAASRVMGIFFISSHISSLSSLFYSFAPFLWEITQNDTRVDAGSDIMSGRPGQVNFFAGQVKCFLAGPVKSISYTGKLTLVLLNPDIPCLLQTVNPDQLASEEAI